MRNTYTPLSQRDPRWANKPLGSTADTLGRYGCLDTSFAIKANYYKNSGILPDWLNDQFTAKNIYLNGELLTDDALTKVFPDIAYVESLDYSRTAADLTKLHDLLADDGTTVTLKVDFDHDPTDGLQTHFVEAVSCDGTTVMIADPWYGTITNFTDHYSDPKLNILKFIVYHGSVVQPVVAPTTPSQPMPSQDQVNTLTALVTALRDFRARNLVSFDALEPFARDLVDKYEKYVNLTKPDASGKPPIVVSADTFVNLNIKAANFDKVEDVLGVPEPTRLLPAEGDRIAGIIKLYGANTQQTVSATLPAMAPISNQPQIAPLSSDQKKNLLQKLLAVLTFDITKVFSEGN